MKLLDDYFKLQKQIYDYFGYKEDWVVIPLNDATEYFWVLAEFSDGHGTVTFANKKELLERDKFGHFPDHGEYYSNEIYTQRFLPKWIYEAPDYTMIVVDTHTDGNKFLQMFDNAKRIA